MLFIAMKMETFRRFKTFGRFILLLILAAAGLVIVGICEDESASLGAVYIIERNSHEIEDAA